MDEKLINILTQSIGVYETLSLSTNLKDFSNWDSMNHMILITNIESNYNIELTGDEIADIQTVDCIAKFIEQKS
jgi:acyl carrier protein